MLKVPQKHEQSKTLHLDEVLLSPELLTSLIDNYFPMGEISLDRGEIIFSILKNTDADSIILKITLFLEECEKDILSALEGLIQTLEPFSKNDESLDAATFALFCLDQKIKNSHNLFLDKCLILMSLN